MDEGGWTVRRADDFPPAGSPANRLLCCTCTSCCATFIGGGLGLLIGGSVGLVAGIRGGGTAAQRGTGVLGIIVGTLARLVAFAALGTAIGAGLGYLIDVSAGTFK